MALFDKIISKLFGEPMKTYDMDVWYDRSMKLWVAAYKDEEGNQIGHCEYGPTKDLVIKYLKMDDPLTRK